MVRVLLINIKSGSRGDLHRFTNERIREKFKFHSDIIQEAMKIVKIENDGLVVSLRLRERVYLPLYIRRYHWKYLKYEYGRVIITREEKDFYACISIKVREGII